MLQRFEGDDGRRLRVEALHTQKLVAGSAELAGELAERVTVSGVADDSLRALAIA